MSHLNVDSMNEVFNYLSMQQLQHLRSGNRILNELFTSIYGNVISKLQQMEHIITTQQHLDSLSLAYIRNMTTHLRLNPMYCDNWDRLIQAACTRWENKSDPFNTNDFEQLLDGIHWK